MKILIITLVFTLVTSCTAHGPKPDSNYESILQTKVWSDRFTGKSSCYTYRKESYINGLMSYNLGFDVECGQQVTLIKSELFNDADSEYVAVRINKTGGVCSNIFTGISNKPKEYPYVLSYWNYGEERVTGPSLRDFYFEMGRLNALDVKPQPMAFSQFQFIREFLLSNEKYMYVRLGGEGGQEIQLSRELVTKFLKDCGASN